MKHLLDLESLNAAQIHEILARAGEMKKSRGLHPDRPLADECWVLMFSKSSTRTRLSFEVGIRELGGQPIFLAANDIQLGRGEPIRDTARVMGRMAQGAVIRTYAQGDVEEFAEMSGIRTINGRTIGMSTVEEPHGPVTRALMDAYKELVGFDFEEQYLNPPSA